MYTDIIIAVAVLIALVVAARHYGTRVHLDGHTLRLVALVIMLAGAGFFALFVIGEIATDPGGATGTFYITLFVAPLLFLSVAAWNFPTISRYALGITTVAVVAFDVWTIVNFDSWREYEDQHGPIVTIAILVVQIPLAIHAYHRDTRISGLTLMYFGLVPPLLRSIAIGDFNLGSVQHLLTLSGFSPSLVVGALYFWSTFRPERVTTPMAPRATA